MNNIYSVEYINSYIKNMFSQDFFLRSVYVRGEVSNVTYHPSGHIYFTMKDKSGVLNCVMYSGKRREGLKFTLKEGQQIVTFGSVTIYEPRGQYQLLASDITLDGAGVLYEKYEKLKNELEEMGMFAEEYKRPIPKYATKIGIVTASTGAAIQDIINISKRRNPYVSLILYPAIVQGNEAARSIVNGIRTLDDYGVDIIIVGRGGGSIEDLWGFNERMVAEAIFECRTPVVSAVGHETDYTIADFVADRRAPTPSAAAEITVFSIDEFDEKLKNMSQRLNERMMGILSYKRDVILMQKTQLLNRLSPEYELNNKRTRLIHVSQRLYDIMQDVLKSKKHEHALCIEKLKALSPLEKLSGGYAYAQVNDRALKGIKDVKGNDEVMLYLKDGMLKTKVEEIIPGGLESYNA